MNQKLYKGILLIRNTSLVPRLSLFRQRAWSLNSRERSLKSAKINERGRINHTSHDEQELSIVLELLFSELARTKPGMIDSNLSKENECLAALADPMLTRIQVSRMPALLSVPDQYKPLCRRSANFWETKWLAKYTEASALL